MLGLKNESLEVNLKIDWINPRTGLVVAFSSHYTRDSLANLTLQEFYNPSLEHLTKSFANLTIGFVYNYYLSNQSSVQLFRPQEEDSTSSAIEIVAQKENLIFAAKLLLPDKLWPTAYAWLNVSFQNLFSGAGWETLKSQFAHIPYQVKSIEITLNASIIAAIRDCSVVSKSFKYCRVKHINPDTNEHIISLFGLI